MAIYTIFFTPSKIEINEKIEPSNYQIEEMKRIFNKTKGYDFHDKFYRYAIELDKTENKVKNKNIIRCG